MSFARGAVRRLRRRPGHVAHRRRRPRGVRLPARERAVPARLRHRRPATVRVQGLAGGAFFRFRDGDRLRRSPPTARSRGSRRPGTPAPGATWPDRGSRFYASYERRARLAGAAAADRPQPRQRRAHARRELRARVRGRSRGSSSSSTAAPSSRPPRAATSTRSSRSSASSAAAALSPSGEVVFSRSTPAPADIFIPDGHAHLDERGAAGHGRDDRRPDAAHRDAVGRGRRCRAGRPGPAGDRAGRHADRDPPADPRHRGGDQPAGARRSAATPRPTTRCAAARRGRSRRRGASTPGAIVGALTRSRASASRTSGSRRTTSRFPGLVKVTVAQRPRRRPRAPGAAELIERVAAGRRARRPQPRRPAGAEPAADLRRARRGSRPRAAGAGGRRASGPRSASRRSSRRARATLTAGQKSALVDAVEAAIERVRRGPRRRPDGRLQPPRRRDHRRRRRLRRLARRLPGRRRSRAAGAA